MGVGVKGLLPAPRAAVESEASFQKGNDALDARTGELLWKASLGGQIVMAPITFMVGGRQYVSVISGHTLVTFGLRE